MGFKDFLLNENRYYLGQKAGDILTAIDNLKDDSGNLGNRALTRATEGIVRQIRRILHSRWDDTDAEYLKRLQKVGVAFMKAIEEKDDMAEVIAGASEEIQKLLNDLETPINALASEKEPKSQDATGDEDMLSKGHQIPVE